MCLQSLSLLQTAVIASILVYTGVLSQTTTEGINEKDPFIVTSSQIDREGGRLLMEKYQRLDSRIKAQTCYRLDLPIPKETEPVTICLRPMDWSRSVFSKNFIIRRRLSDNNTKITTLRDLKRKNDVVGGFVLSYGQSHVRGRITDGKFYGMIMFSPPGPGSSMKMCEVAPISELPHHVNYKDFEDREELDDFILQRTVRPKKNLHGKLDSIVACEDEKMVPSFSDLFLPKNMAQGFERKNKQQQRSLYRRKRDDGSDPVPVDPPPSNPSEPAPSSPSEPAPSSPSEPAPSSPSEPPPSNPSEPQTGQSSPNSNPQSQSNSTSNLNPGKGEHKNPSDHQPRPISHFRTYKFLDVFFEVHPRFVRDRYGGDDGALAVALVGYIEMADWIARASDFNGDQVSDNIGFKFGGVDINIMYKDKVEATVIENLRNHKVKTFLGQLTPPATPADGSPPPEKSVLIYIVPLKNPLYLHMFMGDEEFTYKGCSACSNKMNGLINPAAARYTRRGETIRMLFATMQILISSIVYTENACMGECIYDDVMMPELGGDSWGACVIEGSMFDLSNIPLNAFRLSNCSLEEGNKCIKELEGKSTDGKCFKTEEQPPFCGNGIIEPGEECDCGTLATCQLEKCICGPRDSVLPCVKLTSTDVHLCESLIKCRGFRFVTEVGATNGSYLLSSIPDLVEYRLAMPQTIAAESGGELAAFSAPCFVMITIYFLH